MKDLTKQHEKIIITPKNPHIRPLDPYDSAIMAGTWKPSS